MDKLEIKTVIQVAKPVSVVFDAIIDPAKMSNYFIAKGSGKMEAGKEILWQFPEFETQFPIHVDKVEENNLVSFRWASGEQENNVEISLSPRAGNATLVTVIERGMDNNEAGIKWLKENTEGWANFLACLKAWLEYGINLRKGAFDYMRS